MAALINTWSLPVPNFKPTNINYTVASRNSCLVCHDYDEIDTYARAITLQKLQPLYEQTTRNDNFTTIGTYDPAIFDATILLKELKTVAMPSDQIVLDILKKKGWYSEGSEETLKMIFSIYANFPIKNDQDLLKRQWTVGLAMTEAVQLRQRAIAAGMTSEAMRLEKERAWIKNEMDEDNIVYEWLHVTVQDNLVRKLSQALWNAFMKAKVKSGGFDASDNAQIDYVARARFFHTWLSLSVSYDHDLANNREQLKRLRSDRPVADILYTATEVCKGYADMFEQMFNACEGEEKAISIFGLCRQAGGPQPYAYTSIDARATAHQWAAFPSPNFLTSFKVIDPTWAMIKTDSNHNEDPWFSMVNASISISHMPQDTKNAFLPSGLPLTSEELWRQDQPYLPSEGLSAQYWVDMSSIDPMRSCHTGTYSDGKVFGVSFRNNCRHQGPKTEGFYLGFRETQKNFEDFMNEPFKVDERVAFVTMASPTSGTITWLWAAEIRFKVKRRGWLFIYRETGTFWHIVKTCKRVAIWQV